MLALQERWRVAAEKTKAESAQHTLEEQRKIMVQQIAMEREELERAKVRPDPPPAAEPTDPAQGHSHCPRCPHTERLAGGAEVSHE